MPAPPGLWLALCWDPPAPCSLLSQGCQTSLQHRPPGQPLLTPAVPPPLPCLPSLLQPLFPPAPSPGPASGQPAAYCRPALASRHRVCMSLGSSRAQGQGPALLAWGHPPPTPRRCWQRGLGQGASWAGAGASHGFLSSTAAGFGQHRGSGMQRWLLSCQLCPKPALWYWAGWCPACLTMS